MDRVALIKTLHLPMPSEYSLDLGDFIYYECSFTGLELCEIIREEKEYLQWGVAKGHLVKILSTGKTMIADKSKMFLPLEKSRADKLKQIFEDVE